MELQKEVSGKFVLGLLIAAITGGWLAFGSIPESTRAWLSVIVLFGSWIGWFIYSNSRKWSAMVGLGGGFLVSCVVLIAVIQVENIFETDTDIHPNQTVVSGTYTAEPSSLPPIKDHNYVMNDGNQYGYSTAISDEDKKNGQVAEKLVMVYYAGERDGKFQVHVLDGTSISAMECARPCEYLKIMSYLDNPYLDPQVNIQRIASVPGSIGYLIMQDALNGKLHQYGRGKNNKIYNPWMDENKGMLQILFKP